MSEHRDYYRILGVRYDASQSEIKAAYHRLVRRYHPDHDPSPEAEERIRAVNEAYSVLSDPAKRRDRGRPVRTQRTQRQQPPQQSPHRRPAGVRVGINLGAFGLSISLGQPKRQ